MSGERDGNDYLTMYPELRRWINQCVACQSEGFEPTMPDEARGARNLRRYFPPLSTNELQLCEQCASVLSRTSSD